MPATSVHYLNRDSIVRSRFSAALWPKFHSMRYALDNLGWYEFEQLIQTLLKARLGLGVEAWGGRGDWGRDAYFRGRLRYPANDETPGPFLFQSKFCESANAAGARPDPLIIDAATKECSLITERLKPGGKWSTPPASYSLFTNSPLRPFPRQKIETLLKSAIPSCQLHLHDGNDICQWLNLTRDILRAFPQLLSIRDLNEFLRDCVHADILARSETAIAMAKAESRVFVPTTPYFEALNRLQEHSFVVLEGPPEVGKTTIGRMIALIQLSRGWEAIECRHAEDLLKTHRRQTPQVFVADDFFGRTEYDPARVSCWQADLPHILPRLDSQHWLILTSRAHLLEMAKSALDVAGHNDRFPAVGEVLVDAGNLDKEEKARILYRHAKAADLSVEQKSVLKQNAERIVYHPHFTPERIRRFVVNVIPSLTTREQSREQSVSLLIDEAISNPTKEMRASFRGLPMCHRWLLYSLLVADDLTWTGMRSDALQNRYEILCPDEQKRPFGEVA